VLEFKLRLNKVVILTGKDAEGFGFLNNMKHYGLSGLSSGTLGDFNP
jgi:hypothetical protein